MMDADKATEREVFSHEISDRALAMWSRSGLGLRRRVGAGTLTAHLVEGARGVAQRRAARPGTATSSPTRSETDGAGHGSNAEGSCCMRLRAMFQNPSPPFGPGQPGRLFEGGRR